MRAGGAATVPVKLTGAARRLLAQRPKLKARATVDGAGSSSSAPLVLKR